MTNVIGQVKELRLRVFSEFGGDFKLLTGANVLIYMPHGFGDWVMFSYMLPVMEQSNRYFMTRFGDDYTAVMEGSRWCVPAYMGMNNVHTGDGAALGMHHFGIDWNTIDGTEQTLRLPAPLYEFCIKQEIDALLWVMMPEPAGTRPYPYHTKARFQLRLLVGQDVLDTIDLSHPLAPGISFDVAPSIQAHVGSILRDVLGLGERRLCIVSRTGYTAVGKNWGHMWREEEHGGAMVEGEEARDFMRLLLRKDPRWSFLSMESAPFQGNDSLRSKELNCHTYADVFGVTADASLPFGLVMKALANAADLSVGVPTGPYELCLAKDGLPSVGIWLEHFPSWYDEPREGAVNIVGRNLRDHGLHERTGSYEKIEGLDYRVRWVDTLRITGEQALGAVEELLY